LEAIVDAIARALRSTPFEGKAFVVGGAVRDALLGRPVGQDVDIVVEGDAAACVRLLFERGVAERPPVTYPRFGTAMVLVQGTEVEFVTARRESYSPDSRKPDVEPATILEDAMRRDFTVNTLLRDVFTGATVDPLGKGLDDLRARVLRTPLDAEETFFDDPLRMLRAVRFRWQLGFEPAPGLTEAPKEQAGRLAVISAERIQEEFTKILLLPEAANAVRELMDWGLSDVFAPEFRPMVGCEQKGHHHLDVWGHTLLALSKVEEPDLMLRLGVLFHDIGKPPTKSVEADGRIRFFGHERVGGELARRVLRRLRYSEGTVATVAQLVEEHMRLNSMPTISDSAARRIVRDLGENLERWLRLIEADVSALRPGLTPMDVEAVRRRLAETVERTPAQALVSPLSGTEIMALTGVSPGPEIGTIKAALLEDVLEGRIAPGDRAAAEQRLKAEWRNWISATDVSGS